MPHPCVNFYFNKVKFFINYIKKDIANILLKVSIKRYFFEMLSAKFCELNFIKASTLMRNIFFLPFYPPFSVSKTGRVNMASD